MPDEVSYFEVTSFLADIEADYNHITDHVQRTTELVGRLQKKWPALTTQQAVAYVRLFSNAG